MQTETATCLTGRHLTLFGALVQAYARHEVLIEEIIAKISGADATSIKLLTCGLSFTQKHDAFFNLLRHRAMPRRDIDQIGKFLEVLQTHALLRNDIAHSTWIAGDPRTLILPAWLSKGPKAAVKPDHDIGRSGSGFREIYEDSVTYTVGDLEEIVMLLDANFENFRDFARERDLVPQLGVAA